MGTTLNPLLKGSGAKSASLQVAVQAMGLSLSSFCFVELLFPQVQAKFGFWARGLLGLRNFRASGLRAWAHGFRN